ncbi:hypothetical protein B566_EDAN008495 [Ephemera danica]|nr:hypothetical protein B566_EDAN008495 [Ephemera danica]
MNVCAYFSPIEWYVVMGWVGERDTPSWQHHGATMLHTGSARRVQQRRLRPRTNSGLEHAAIWTAENEQLITACRLFFASWLRRSESLRGRWQREAAPLSSFDHKIRHLRNEIAGLAAQDTQLFRQLFALQESIDELKEQFEGTSSHSSSPSSRCSLSPATSSVHLHPDEPSSITSAPACYYEEPNAMRNTSFIRESPTTPGNNTPRRQSLEEHTSFVRQRVSYPPSARNRCRRSQTLQTPRNAPILRRPRSASRSHGTSSSLDSGIHTSDHEIFV